MAEWIVKKDDFVHWYKSTKQCCVGSSTSTSPPPPTTSKPQICGSSSPAFGAKDSIDNFINGCNNKNENEAQILQQLRSNPSLVEATSFSSSYMIADKRGDHQSTGSLTLPDSDHEEERELVSKKNRRSTRFLLCVALAVILALVSIGLVVAILMRNRNTAKLNNSPSDTGNAGELVNITTKLNNSESSTGNDGETVDTIILSNSTSSTGNAGETVGFDYNANTNYLVGTYYYPWYGDNFHNGEGYLRQDLIPQQQPALGEYNDSEAQVIAQHMQWFRQANIGLLVTSWWGPNRREDNTTKNVIMEHKDIGNLKIALHYETTGRIKDDGDMSVPRSDIQYMCENYFDHPNYYKIDGRPVLVVYVTRVLHREGILEEALLTMRSEASKCGHNLYLIGDQVFGSAPDPEDEFVPFWYFDAVTNYDVYGATGRPGGYAGKEAVDMYYSDQEEWREQALKVDCHYIPAVSPGYNYRGVRLQLDRPPLSRRLTRFSEEGSLFWYQLKQALPLVSPEVDSMILVNSFNEWHEDTQIEPVVSRGTMGDDTSEPPLLTGGLEYVAYGELYLDLLGAATSKNVEDAALFDDLYI
jgi:glycoprotein endo-alpha-1,2-mannosidase